MLLYLMFVTFIFTQINGTFIKFNFIRVKNKTFITTKAPYRNKTTRNQYLKFNYFYKLSIVLGEVKMLYSQFFFNINKISRVLVTFEFSFMLINYVRVHLSYKINLLKLFKNAQSSSRL